MAVAYSFRDELVAVPLKLLLRRLAADCEHFCTYSILEAPLPVQNYIVTLRFAPITAANQTFAQWTAEFEAPSGQEAETKSIVEGIFQDGLDNLNRILRDEN